jgi:FlaA1/EpsC-like NDP-sugar epimerase
MFTLRRFIVFLLDLLLIVESYFLAQVLDNDFNFALFTPDYLLHTFLIIIAAQALVFLTSNLYRSIWMYASLHDMVEIFKTVTIACVMGGLLMFFFRQGEHFSRVTFVLDWGLLLLQIGASRLCWRIYRERFYSTGGQFLKFKTDCNKKRTLIVGAGDAGNMLLREINKQPDSTYQVVGFIDDDPSKLHQFLLGVEVLAASSDLGQIISKQSIDKVIIAVPSAGPRFVRDLVAQCQKSGVHFKIIPGLSEIIKGNVKVSHIRNVEIEDLLGRTPIHLDEKSIGCYLSGKRVLVSGAAGSIGSEICRQIAAYSPTMLVLLENAETPLFYIERELSASFPTLRIIPYLCDVRNLQHLEQIFDATAPEVVFHAAAYKHVPLVEQNPTEGVLCNVLGSMNMATVSQQFGVRNFVLISTDKAVNPTNIMGTTKRIAEKFVQSLSDRSHTKFSIVRFGNVLGSNGSVIPLFMEQIRNGGPLTITHPEVTRFFMTIPEASQLVLQSACLGNGGEIFVLDMGEPVRIVELAEQLVRLSGMAPYSDIEFVYTGLRPGEKLYEELFFRGENILPTLHNKIHVLAPISENYEILRQQLEVLLRLARENDVAALIPQLCKMVPEYTPTARGNT